MNKLNEISTADLSGSTSIADMATSEGWEPDFYACSLAEHIRNTNVPMDMQRERIRALAQLGAGLAGAQASADELSQHYAVLDSLFHRFAMAAHGALQAGGPRASEIAERYLSASLKAQRASLATLSALKMLREEVAAPTTAAAIAAPSGAAVAVDTLEATQCQP